MPRDHRTVRLVGRRHVLLVALVVLVGLVVSLALGPGLSTHAGGLIAGIPAWAKVAAILPIVAGLHPLLAALHPLLVLLISIAAAVVRRFRCRTTRAGTDVR